MKIAVILFFFFVFSPLLSHASESNIETLLNEANTLYEATLFESCEALLEKILQNPSENNEKRQFIKLRLSQCYFFTKRYQNLIELLTDLEGMSFHETQEALFLLGLAHAKLQNYQDAVACFEKYLSEPNLALGESTEETLYQLGWSLIYQCEKDLSNRDFLKNHLFKSEQVFKQLITLFPSERAHLGLAQALLLQGIYLKSQKALQELEELLQEVKFKNVLSFSHAKILIAESEKSYEKKNKMFQELTEEEKEKFPFLANAWYLKGLNAYLQAENLMKEKQTERANNHFIEAIDSFNRVFSLVYPSELAALSLKYEGLAHFHMGTREHLQKGLNSIEKLLENESLVKVLDHPEEIDYLHGLIAARLAECETDKTFFTLAKNSLTRVIRNNAKSDYHLDSLYLLATLYDRFGDTKNALEIYLRLAAVPSNNLKESDLIANALYFASNCQEKLNVDSAQTKHLRKMVWQKYPNAKYAAEAFFRTYDFADYISGRKSALEHLEDFLCRYPKSPFILNAHYLLALNQLNAFEKRKKRSHFEAALMHFCELEKAFCKLEKEQSIKEECIAIRYQALLDKAQAALKIGEDGQKIAKESLLAILSDFGDTTHNLTKNLLKTEQGIYLQSTSALELTKCYLLEGDEPSAIQLLEAMIEKYRKDLANHRYLAKCWFEKGVIHKNRSEYPLAIQCFQNAEKASPKDVLSADELLEIWLEKSLCHRYLNEMDMAMLLLSKIINFDAVSQKRIVAMFLRAEIYEDQGRHELAKKQLEAILKKGGRLSIKAEEKLKEKYAYH